MDMLRLMMLKTQSGETVSERMSILLDPMRNTLDKSGKNRPPPKVRIADPYDEQPMGGFFMRGLSVDEVRADSS